MSTRKALRCIVDDTALITNISEIKKWTSNRSITLIIPVYTLERLAFLKRDTSQIGINARQTVEFLDKVTEGKNGNTIEAISLQGPTEQYKTWLEVEKYAAADTSEAGAENKQNEEQIDSQKTLTEEDSRPNSVTPNTLSQMLLDKLNFAKETDLTPPASPDSSNNPSAKASPEMDSVLLSSAPAVPTPLKSLVNAVVWQAQNISDAQNAMPDIYFVSNSADTCALMRRFGVKTKNVHQLRQAIGLEDQEVKNQLKYIQKNPSPPGTSAGKENEGKATLHYDEDSDEELVFKPRGRGNGNRATQSASHSPTINVATPAARPSSSHYTPRAALEAQNQSPKPEIPTGEIDPDSFDRGSFGRSQGYRLASYEVGANSYHRSPVARGGFGPNRGFYRGRGFGRGAVRGRGRLFVP